MSKPNHCDHIVGRAWILNPEEGPIYVNRYIRLSGGLRGIEPEDWSHTYKHCPLCGAEQDPIEGVEVLK